MSILGFKNGISINIDTRIGDTSDIFKYDYLYTFLMSTNMNSSQPDRSLNNLFDTRTYKYSKRDREFDLNLTINTNRLLSIINNPQLSQNVTPGQYNGVNTLMTNVKQGSGYTIGNRLIETIAIKLFGNANATSAISNISYFNSSAIVNHIANTISTAVSTKSNQNFIFDQYVDIASDSYDFTTDKKSDRLRHFNFDRMNMQFPMFLNGTINDPSNTYLNGSNLITVGNKIQNGSYSIPIMLEINGS